MNPLCGLSFALWTLINTYDDQPDMVKRVVFKLTQSGVRGSTILDAFYTYAFADPETFKFVSGDVTMARPDVIEA